MSNVDVWSNRVDQTGQGQVASPAEIDQTRPDGSRVWSRWSVGLQGMDTQEPEHSKWKGTAKAEASPALIGSCEGPLHLHYWRKQNKKVLVRNGNRSLAPFTLLMGHDGSFPRQPALQPLALVPRSLRCQ